MNLILLLLIVCLSYFIIRAGAVALELTGLDKHTAIFQAISAYTTTGFTTREAERIVNHPRRRRIITYLIVMGNVGIVSTVSTTVLSLTKGDALHPLARLGILVVALAVFFRLVTRASFTRGVNERIRRYFTHRLGWQGTQIEELLRQAQGRGVAAIHVGPESPLVGKRLDQTGMTAMDLMTLSVERGGDLLPVPHGDTVIQSGDHLTIYGVLDHMNRLV